MFPLRWAFILFIFLLAPPHLMAGGQHFSPIDFAEVFSLLKKEQYQPGPINAKQAHAMLGAALARAAEESGAFNYSMHDGWRGTTLRIRVGGTAREFSMSGIKSLGNLQPLLQAVSTFISTRTSPSVHARLTASLTSGLLAPLDANARLLQAEDFCRFQALSSGLFAGVGMILEKEIKGGRQGKGVRIKSLLPRSPAARAGLRPGDRLLRIAKSDTTRITLEQSHQLLRGTKNTQVRLRLKRHRHSRPFWVTLRRESLIQKSVEGRLIRNGSLTRVGYLQIRNFYENTPEEVRKELIRFRPNKRGLKGLVLDLRGNPGGMIDSAVGVANLFLNRGAIATIQGTRTAPRKISASWHRSIPDTPLVVLVDENTASSAELLAGTLKENRRALVLGNHTYGKNTVQRVFPLSNGYGLKLTIARFKPAGKSLSVEYGVVPHVLLAPVHFDVGKKLTEGLLSAIALSQKGSTHPLSNLGRQALTTLPYLSLSALASKVGGDRDFPLKFAVDTLQSNGRKDTSALVRGALLKAASERMAQWRVISRKLAEQGVDWRTATTAGGARLTISRLSLQVNTMAGAWQAPGNAEEKVKGFRLKFWVRNGAEYPVERVIATLKGLDKPLSMVEIPIGRLKAGESRETQVILPLAEPLAMDFGNMRLELFDGQPQLQFQTGNLMLADVASL